MITICIFSHYPIPYLVHLESPSLFVQGVFFLLYTLLDVAHSLCHIALLQRMSADQKGGAIPPLT